MANLLYKSIILTVLSILASNLWSRFFIKILDEYTNSFIADLASAFISTLAVILIMEFIFKDDIDKI